MNRTSDNIAAALIFLGFFSLIGFSIWAVGNAWPLLALVLAPTINSRKGDCDCENGEE